MRILTFCCLLLITFSCKNVTTPQVTKVQKEAFVLEHLVQEPTVISTNTPILILLHGLGSNEKDLFSFAKFVPKNWLVVSVRAPFDYAKKPSDKFKWYDLKLTPKKHITNYKEVANSEQLLLKFIKQIKSKYNIKDSKIVMGGFSQGAIMSYQMGLLHPEELAGVASFSGRILETTHDKMNGKRGHKSIKVFIAHGKQDKVLLYKEALAAKKLFESLGIQTTNSFDDSEHNISQTHLQAFVQWLQTI